jgi:GalNAc-alpha-(1->4)-GalNAc-alpha-(1->3)-diNAcBac-PP-undecaprenol alpha-1,4-N-acetyl-D-galactosaminyltransferase
MKILFVSRLFHDVSGGVERMSIELMNEMVARGHDVDLLSWDRKSAMTFYALDTRVTWHKLDLGDAQLQASWMMRARRQIAIRRLLKKIEPDVLIAFQNGPFLAAAVAALGLSIPGISAERNAPQRYDHTEAGRWRSIIFQTFRLADCITVQLPNYIEHYPAFLRARMVCIPNPVRLAATFAQPGGTPGSQRILLSVGRLSFQKNQAVLIDAFGRLASQFSDWKLMLVGAGDDEAHLRGLVSESGLSGRVDFTGASKDVQRYYAQSHLFCLPSRWEGFPNALAEAMAHGLPAVGFADCAGVGQLIEPGRTGRLATVMGSAASLAESLAHLMSDDHGRQAMGSAAISAMEKYAPREIFDRWELLFKKIARLP